MQVQLSRFAERPGLFHQKDLQLIMDILTPANNTALGNGWFPLEIFGAEKFRWVSNAAEVYAAAFRNVKHYLQIYLEPGPSLDFKPFELLVTENDETVARATIKGRHMISIELPATQPMLRKFVLRTEGSDKPAPGEIRVLNYRVFKLIFVQAIVDILPPEMNARPGEGWYPLETFNGETFRWASNDAKIEIADPAELKTLQLEIEPGPGVESKPFTLRVFEDSGVQIAETEIVTRQSVSIPVDGTGREGPLSISLHADGGDRRIGSDQRIMNFRVYQHSPDLNDDGSPKTSANQPEQT